MIKHKPERNITRELVIYSALLSFILKVLVAMAYEGFQSDLNLYTRWALYGSENLWRIYQQQYPPDYPPLYLYVLSLMGLIIRRVPNPEYLNIYFLLVKMPPMVLDIVCALLLMKLFIGKSQRMRLRLILMTLMLLFNPALIVNSSIYGQTDIFYAFLVLASTISILYEKHLLWMISAGLLVLLKPTGAFILPLIGIESISLLMKKQFKKLIGSILAAIAVCGTVVAPFVYHMGLSWFKDIYLGGAKKYSHGSHHGANLMTLLGGDLKPDTELFLGGVSYFVLSIAFLALFSLAFAWLYLKYPHMLNKPAMALLWFSGVYMLSVRMHERYNFVQILLAAVCYLLYEDARYLRIFSAISAVGAINYFIVVYFSNQQPTRALWYPEFEMVMFILALINFIVFLYTIYTAFHTIRSSKLDQNPPVTKAEGLKS